jgi:hypothetical protein
MGPVRRQSRGLRPPRSSSSSNAVYASPPPAPPLGPPPPLWGGCFNAAACKDEGCLGEGGEGWRGALLHRWTHAKQFSSCVYRLFDGQWMA